MSDDFERKVHTAGVAAGDALTLDTVVPSALGRSHASWRTP
jgi:hypothetical protein